jgi:hypothetical protein
LVPRRPTRNPQGVQMTGRGPNATLLSCGLQWC